MRTNRTLMVYGLLALAWLLLSVWQGIEHWRVRDAAKAALLNRALDISRSVGAVERSQLFPFIGQARIERALTELVKQSELLSVALLNQDEAVVASAGAPIKLDAQGVAEQGEHWEGGVAIFRNLVDLGATIDEEATSHPRTIIMTTPTLPSRSARGSGARGGRWRFPRRLDEETSGTELVRRWEFPLDAQTGIDVERTTQAIVVRVETPRPETQDETRATSVSQAQPQPSPPRGSGRRGSGGRRRPPWMSKEQFEDLQQRRGVHDFVLVMSTDAYRAEIAQDFRLRLLSSAIALMAALGLGIAWRGVDRSGRLQLRLIRASEMNAHLREMNIAAAGLAHETRNPLNIVRGLAQMISKESDAPEDIHTRSTDIVEEVDRVTSRLGEFIEYSRPPEAKPAPVAVGGVVRDIERALESDLEEKSVQIAFSGPALMVEADESLLRQVLFNLLLNAVQAVDEGGSVEVRVEQVGAKEAVVEVRDDGPGVPPEIRDDVFRPYVTTHEGGTGLGLAVVRQIVLAHHWEIEYIPGAKAGSRFRISGLKILGKAS